MSRLNRRTFLKTSALGAPALLGAAGAAAADFPADKPPLGKGGQAAHVTQPQGAAAGPTFNFTRQLPVETGYDLVVAGGGPAGAAAAVCAARLGAKVLLLEATGCLGGMGTSGLVTAFDPMSDGKKMLVGGLMRAVVMRMRSGAIWPPTSRPTTS